jgi:hypothetical protein
MTGAEIWGHSENLMETHWELEGNMLGTKEKIILSHLKTAPKRKIVEPRILFGKQTMKLSLK